MSLLLLYNFIKNAPHFLAIILIFQNILDGLAIHKTFATAIIAIDHPERPNYRISKKLLQLFHGWFIFEHFIHHFRKAVSFDPEIIQRFL